MSEKLAEIFQCFAQDEFQGSSPLYERLSLAIAQDPELLALAAQCRTGERIPNLFFAAVHYLLLSGIAHPLIRFYPTLGGSYDGRDDPFADFRSFCLDFSEQIRQIISVRLVQTNEVSRCAGLMPLIVTASKDVPDRPLYLVDIGASAGLNLFWDYFGYRYGNRIFVGEKDSSVQIECALQANFPPMPKSFPRVCERVGLDLNPLDVRNPEDSLWLRALIWPEHKERAELLRHAIGIARSQSLRLLAGDGAGLLSEIMNSVPGEAVLVIVRIFTRVSQPSRERLSTLVQEYGAKHDLMMITARPNDADVSELLLTSFVSGKHKEQCLARMQNHGNWLEWMEAA